MNSITKIMYVSLAGLITLCTSCSQEAPQNQPRSNQPGREDDLRRRVVVLEHGDRRQLRRSVRCSTRRMRSRPFSGSMSTDYALDYNRGGSNVLGTPAYSFPIARVRFVIDEKFPVRLPIVRAGLSR